MEGNALNKKEFEFILEQGEGQLIEFKEKADRSLSKEMVAFSNSQGGRIFIGISDDGNVKGINITNKLKSQITDIAKNCDPPITLNLSSFSDKVLIVEVPEGENKPYSCSQGFFVRIGANSQKLSRDEILNFSISEGRKTFDEEINERFRYPDDFDEEKLREYLKEAGLSPELDVPSILINLGLAVEEKGELKLNNAGVLFFAKEPSRFFLSSKVVCAEYATDNKVDILDRKIYDDGILGNIKNSINFVKKHIKVRFEIEGARRKEIPQFPETAFREAIVNAIMHRDYFDKSSDVMVEVFRNKLAIYNPGGLVKWLKPSEFGKISRTRNPIIASLLSRTIFVEKMGTGIGRMQAAMKEAGLPDIEFEYSEHSFHVVLEGPEVTVKDTLKDTVKDTVKELSKNERKIYEIMKENPKITAEQLSEILGINLRNTKRNIAKLKEKGLIVRVGSDKAGHWEVVE